MPYVRTKRIKGILYYYLVEGYRTEDGKVRQRVLAYLGQHQTVGAAYDFWRKQLQITKERAEKQHAKEMIAKLKPYL